MIQEFLNELNALQDKYGIYIDADHKENWGYRWDGKNEWLCSTGTDAYVVFVNKGGYEIQGVYRDEDLHYHI